MFFRTYPLSSWPLLFIYAKSHGTPILLYSVLAYVSCQHSLIVIFFGPFYNKTIMINDLAEFLLAYFFFYGCKQYAGSETDCRFEKKVLLNQLYRSEF